MTNQPSPPTTPPTLLRGALFTIHLPCGWTDTSIYCASGPVTHGIPATIAVTLEHLPAPKEADVFADEQIKLLEPQLNDFQLVERGKRAIGSLQVPWVLYTWNSPEGKPIKQAQWYVAQQSLFIVITASAHAEAFEEIGKEIVDATASFTLCGGKGTGRLGDLKW